MRFCSCGVAGLIFSIGLIGCSNTGLDPLAVSGPSVYLKKDEVEFTTENYVAVRQSFYRRASFNTEYLPSDGDPRWYTFIRHGWKHVDVECQRFLKALRAAEKQRQLITRQLADTGSSVRNILNTLSASQRTLNLVAESIGLLTQTVDNLHESLLLRLPSSVVINDVQKRQSTEREKVRIKVTQGDHYYLSEIGAFEAIGDYLKLCLVHQIEARIPNNLSLTDYIALPDGRVVPVSMHAVANRIRQKDEEANLKAAEVLRRDRFRKFLSQRHVGGGKEASGEKKIGDKVPKIRGGITEYEKKEISLSRGKLVQTRLCVPDTGNFGPMTRKAIGLYREVLERRLPETKRQPVEPPHVLTGDGHLKATTIINLRRCETPKIRNVVENIWWSRSALNTSTPLKRNQSLALALASLKKNLLDTPDAANFKERILKGFGDVGLVNTIAKLKGSSELGPSTRAGFTIMSRMKQLDDEDAGLPEDRRMKETDELNFALWDFIVFWSSR